jgi:hypothetical protein
MQIKLWPKNEVGLKEIAKNPDYVRLKISISKIANLAISQFVTATKSAQKKKC